MRFREALRARRHTGHATHGRRVPIMLHSVKYADQRGTTVQEIDVSGPCDVNGSPSALVDARARHQLIEDQM